MFASAVIFAWPLVVLAIFAKLPPRRAVVWSIMIAFLFLPIVKIDVPILPDVTKMSATLGAICLAIVIFDLKRLKPTRILPSLVDLPMIVWCLTPLITSITNAPDTKLWDGVSWSSDNIVTFGLPYFVGRLYFSSLDGLKELATGIFIGGLVYVPLCLFEMKMSPQLHHLVYGYHQHDFLQTIRDGGYRPMVFMVHGLQVAMFMASASICGLWLWSSGAIRKVRAFPVGLLLIPLIGVSLAMRSVGAALLLVLGTVVTVILQKFQLRVVLAALLLVPMLYVSSRTIFRWDGYDAVDFALKHFGPERAQSLDFRFNSEELMIDKIEKHQIFGWGGYGRSFVLDKDGKLATVPDSFWVIAYGLYGAVGLVAELAFTWPIFLMLARIPRGRVNHPAVSGALAIATLLTLYAMDNMVNSMPNPIYILGLGGLCGLCTQPMWQFTQARAPELKPPARPERFTTPELAMP